MKRLFLIVLVALMTLPAWNVGAQSKGKTITGVVLDETGQGAPGVPLVVKNSSRGVITDENGNFSILASPEDVLKYSYLGYEDGEMKVGNQTKITITLVPVSDWLEDVTIVAYGTQRKASVIGSISTISQAELKSPVGQLSTGLAGKLAGVVAMQRSGEPGSSAEFWIRGVSSFGASNSPLVLVDGVERSMDLVDVEDIASFSILKDASATALYGVRGANGIVIITTRRGSESKPRVNFKAEYGMTQPVKIPALANTTQWIDYYNELFVDQGSEPAISDYERQMYLSGSDPDLYPSVDWMRTIYKDAANTSKINVNVTGGTKNVRYYVGVSYYHEDGIFNVAEASGYSAGDNALKFTKMSFRSNVDINITKNTVLALSLGTSYDVKNSPAHSLSDIYAFSMYSTPIATPLQFSDGTLAWPDKGQNPYSMINYSGYQTSTNMNSQSLVSLTQDFSDIITEGLTANVKFSWDALNGNVLKRTINNTYYFALGRDPETGELMYGKYNDGTGYMTLSNNNISSTTTTNFEASVNYERLFAYAHRVSAMMLYSMRNKQLNIPGSYIASFPYRNMGLAGRATYSYKDRYFAEFNFGYNGSENFAPGHRFGFFPSFAVGYMISNESFWTPIKPYVDDLKFKSSFGKIGNDQIGGNRRFAYNTTMNTNAPGFTFGSSFVSQGGVTTGDYGNPNVSWEEATKFDAGFEVTLFKRLKIQADYFYDYRDGIFIQRESIPSIVGINVDQWVNIGKMQNQGFDMSLQYDQKVGQVNLSARGNFTYNRNKKLYDDKPSQPYAYQNLVGYPYQQQFGLVSVGLFESQDDIDNWPVQKFGNPRPGDIKYVDVNGDGYVDSYDMVPIGYTTIPEITYGFGLSANWHGFDASVFFQGVGHVTRIISGQNLFGASTQIAKLGQIFADVAENRWTLDNQNPNAPYPRLAMNKVDNNQQPSTYWQKDMSFLRLKNAEIGYTLPKKITQKVGIPTARVYLQGVNLITFSKFKLWDPELNASYGNQYPTMRTYCAGVNINF